MLNKTDGTVTDIVNNPQHYTRNKIETLDVILDIVENPTDYCIGNIIKYISRYKYKGTPLTDLEKANYYLKIAINLLKEEQNTDF